MSGIRETPAPQPALRAAAERVLKEARLMNVAFSVPTPAMAALSCAINTQPDFVWRDFITAPKDGSTFLATGGGLGSDIDIVNYNERVGCWNATNYTLDDTDHEPDGYSRPTHWMPLPEPPVTE